MIEVKFQGSGGHGVVVAGKILADAAAKGGYRSQAFASYGALRRGGKVESYVRIHRGPILPHSKVYAADYLVFMDEAFARDPEFSLNIKGGGKLLINTDKPPDRFRAPDNVAIWTVNANKFASENGLELQSGITVINTTMLGAIAGMIQEVDEENLFKAIRDAGIPAAEKNVEASRAAYEWIRSYGRKAAVISPAEVAERVTIRPYPVFDVVRCNLCGICELFCPDLAIKFEGEPPRPAVLEDRCKGCGICVIECPRRAVSLEGVSR